VKTVFVVDDSPLIVSFLKTTLEGAGFKVDTAADGAQALAKLKIASNKPDLIITDINMPNMNGLDLIKNVRMILRFTPILALTTENQTSKRDDAKRLGASGWLTKPITPSDLIKVVKQVVPGS
jgi:two-component system chemotaxis response regulator CheY